MEDRKILTINEKQVVEEAHEAAAALAKRASAVVNDLNTPITQMMEESYL